MAKLVFWKGFTILFLWIGLGIFVIGLVDPIAEPIVAPLTGLGICILTLYLYRSARSGKLRNAKYLEFLFDERFDNHVSWFTGVFGCTVGLLVNFIIFVNNLSKPPNAENYVFQTIRQQRLFTNNIEIIFFGGMVLIMMATTGYLIFIMTRTKQVNKLNEEMLS